MMDNILLINTFSIQRTLDVEFSVAFELAWLTNLPEANDSILICEVRLVRAQVLIFNDLTKFIRLHTILLINVSALECYLHQIGIVFIHIWIMVFKVSRSCFDAWGYELLMQSSFVLNFASYKWFCLTIKAYEIFLAEPSGRLPTLVHFIFAFSLGTIVAFSVILWIFFIKFIS